MGLRKECVLVDLPEETLMAYADGALNESERRHVEAILAADPAQQRRLEPYIFTRDALPSVFSEALTSAVPDRLVATVMTAPVGTTTSRGAKSQTRAPLLERLREALFPEMPAFAGTFALAASLAAVAGLGYAAAQFASPQSTLAGLDSEAVATGPLKVALDTTVSKGVLERGLLRVQMLSTFVDREGRYCRQYEMAHASKGNVAGFACRQAGGDWSIAFHAPEAAAGETAAGTHPGEFTPAGRSPASSVKPVDRAIDAVMDGGVIEGAEEEEFIARGWQSPASGPKP